MPGPYHEFLMLSRTDYRFSDYGQFINDPSAIRIEDDLILYIYDTLKWLPTLNPAKDESQFGLSYYGPTVIHIEGARLASEIFNRWAGLFACGPQKLMLTGSWSWIEDQSSDGKYEMLEFDRDELVGKLQQIAEFANQVAVTDGKFFVLHIGI